MTVSSARKPIATFALALAATTCAQHSETLEPRAVVQDQLTQAFDTANEVSVIVNFREAEALHSSADRWRHREALAKTREQVLAASQGGLTVTRQFEHVPAVAGRLSRAALALLSKDPNVTYIQIDEKGGGALKVSVPAIGGITAKTTYHVTGKGVTVAVLDTGANTTHADLKTSIAATQHCFTQNACPPGNTAEGTSAEDDNGHGSHVAGIITSDGVSAGAGFAPDAQVIAVKIDDKNDAGMLSDWIKGLDWVYSNLSTLKVKVVNMSICSTTLYAGNCDNSQPAFAKSVSNLVNSGVTLFAASGNAGSSSQLSVPACLSGVIAVGATYKSDQGAEPDTGTYQQKFGSPFPSCSDATTAFDKVTCFTNSNSRLDIVAPGAVIESDYLGNQLGYYWGTSQASPTAAGVAALMLECNPNLTPTQIRDIMKSTGVSVSDPKNGLSFPSLRADAAVKSACGSTGGSSSGGSSSSSSSTGGSIGTGGTKQATGGAPSSSTGGSIGTGGSKQATGGAASSGGSGGSNGSSGGSSNGTGTGGNQATGGASSSGGVSAATGGLRSDSGGASSTVTSVTPSTGGSVSASTTTSPDGTQPGVQASGSCSCTTAGSQPLRRATFAGVLALAGFALTRRKRTA